jgi:hypothetical protein
MGKAPNKAATVKCNHSNVTMAITPIKVIAAIIACDSITSSDINEQKKPII